ncbi:MAG: NAD-dependent epimerase/dehydratase family protein [Candidatus Eisenbacteria bacterium]
MVGGDGFLGSHIAHVLIAAGRRVTTLSRGHHAPVEGAERLVADRRDATALAAALGGRRFDLTVDLAAYNAPDIETLWSVPRAALGRTVMISTGQVYMVTESTRRRFREGDSLRPVQREPEEGSRDHGQWSYGIGKRAAEAVLLALRRHQGVRALVLRLPVVQGEGDPTLRLWAWLERMLDGGPIVLPDGGVRATRFLDVADVGPLIERIASGFWPRGAVYNLAAPRVTTLRRFLALAARAAGVQPDFAAIPKAAIGRLGLDIVEWPFAGRWSSVLDPSRARRGLGFTGTPPEDYLPRVVGWHLEHRPAASHPGYAQRAAEREAVERWHAERLGTGEHPAGPELGIA